jgi:hypothetical protein
MNDSASGIDRRPIFWALAVSVGLFLVWLGFHFAGEQRYYNTAWWQARRPIVLTSAPQTAQPVEVRNEWRNALTVIQTEKGLYFLSGTKYVPSAGTQVVIEANDHWELYMCDAEGKHCMPIHSFCAGAVWPKVKRDDKGYAENCYAPYTGKRTAEDLKKPPPATYPPEGKRPGKQFKQMAPAFGMSHPSEWAHLMGLPVPVEQPAPAKP